MSHPVDRLLPYVTGHLDAAGRAEIEAHTASCRDCADALREADEMHRVLVQLPAAAVPADFADRIRARTQLGSARVYSWRHLAAAACLVLAAGALGGWTAARTLAAAPAPIVRNAEGGKFAILFIEDPASWRGVSREEASRRSAAFVAWMRLIGDTDTRLGGAQLHRDGGRIYGPGPLAVAADDAPPREPSLTGFLVVRAGSYDEVARYAARCPILDRGGQVVVRQMY